MKGRVDAQALLREGERGSGLEEGSWRELSKQRLTDDDVQAGIAAGHWMTDPIAFRRIEEQCLTGVSQRQVASEMSHEQAAIREHKMRGGGAFFRTRVSTSTQAGDIADGD